MLMVTPSTSWSISNVVNNDVAKNFVYDQLVAKVILILVDLF